MKKLPLVMLALAAVLMCVVGASAKGTTDTDFISRVPTPTGPAPAAPDHRGARLETLWIFDADFEDPEGEFNVGWQSFDRSGTLASENFWHHDTIHMKNLPHLGDSTWWCGTENNCWRQPRGYANGWVQILERSFPEVAANTNVGDLLTLDWDQRYAMEHDYDYGYVEVSTDGGDTWNELYYANNTGFAGLPGAPKDWEHGTEGHKTIDISAYAGLEIDLRFRFESDDAYSSQDQYNNAPQNSVKDGAWQLDNIQLTGPGGIFFDDDAESGNMGWVHDDTEAHGQTGVVFERRRFVDDIETGQDFTCDDRPAGSWMYAAVDPFTSTMVDDQFSWLMSPPIDISGAPKLVGQWDQWVDLPRPANDIFNLYLASNDLEECVTDPAGFVDEETGWWYGGPFWGVWTDDWDAFAGNEWLAILWAVQNDEPPNEPHAAGVFLNRQRVGVPSGDAGTVFERDQWTWFNDWFQDDLTDALLDTGRIKIKDDDDIVEAHVVASNDEGATWSAYACRREDEESNWWYAPPPDLEMTPGSVIRYYIEAMDGVGNLAVYPNRAPDRFFEMSILPITATATNQGILLVDKHGRLTPGAERNYRHSSEYYYREALEILGYSYEKYDVEVPSGSTEQSAGPDTSGMKYYDTQIWFVNEFDSYTIKAPDQANLIQWLNMSNEDFERNLLITGNDVGKELMATGKETLQFYETWLASHYLDNSVGAVTVDSVPTLEDHAGDWVFMNHADGTSILRGGCPTLNYFDVVEPFAGIAGTEIVADYVRTDDARRPAGVAYTHATAGYQTVNLGFGVEFMMDSMQTSRTQGYYNTGLDDRVNLMKNIMDYFDVAAEGDGTGVVDGGAKNALAQAYPNPFNPVTKIAYSVRESGRVTIDVYNVSGKVVRTLLDKELEAGSAGNVIWDGSNDVGERCASGVYFYRITAPGFTTAKKMVMMK